ncbi:hypothetical protein OL548_26450 [Lysinibacillus sp. MHQ-1]|nr:hypothetical protein OL548_26450 [Lysinibacillus sp. MHQ-1]
MPYAKAILISASMFYVGQWVSLLLVEHNYKVLGSIVFCSGENCYFIVLVQRIFGCITGGVGHFTKAKLRSEAIAGANTFVFNRPILSLAQDDTVAL